MKMPLELTQSRVQKIWIPIDHRPSLPRSEYRHVQGPGGRGAARRAEGTAIVRRAPARSFCTDSSPPTSAFLRGRCLPPPQCMRAGRRPLLPGARGGDSAALAPALHLPSPASASPARCVHHRAVPPSAEGAGNRDRAGVLAPESKGRERGAGSAGHTVSLCFGTSEKGRPLLPSLGHASLRPLG